MVCRLPREPGVYIIIIRVGRDISITTRGGKRFTIPSGMYLYIGSAMGKGGIYRRVARHINKPSSLFWHIDYLLHQPSTEILGILYKTHEDREDYEARLALAFKEIFTGIPGFGCSDKPKDYSHLYLCGYSEDECLERINETGIADLTYCRINDLAGVSNISHRSRSL